MDDIIKEFISESLESIEIVDQSFVQLEQNPHDDELIAKVFRAIHTIKGTCGFLGFGKLESVTHAGEGLLALIRDGKLTIDKNILSGLLRMVDAVRGILASIQSSGKEGDERYQSVVDELNSLQNKGVSQATEQHVDEPVKSVEPQEQSVSTASSKPAQPSNSGHKKSEPSKKSPDSLASILNTQIESSIRVDVEILDRLMNMVGELVLIRNQILQNQQGDSNHLSTNMKQRLDHLTSDLQQEVMKTRMQPIGNIWSKFPRVVRDLANICQKEVNIVMDGQSTELDKNLIESLRDPLTHLVRNAIDHGLELPDERVQVGKPREGQLLFKAYHEGGQVHIEIADDGAGIDVCKIKHAAILKELVDEQQAESMSNDELIQLIFHPGFSTAQKVSHISGRGVGMDVVKSNIEKIGGKIEIHSEPSKGTTFKIKVPLTLTILPSLLVKSSNTLFAIPQANLVELIKVDKDSELQVENICGSHVYRYREELLPLVYLNGVLQNCEKQLNEENFVVVIQAGENKYGLIVDEILETQEIVVKPVGRYLKELSIYAGTTIMGNGQVTLILDVNGLAQKANLKFTKDQYAQFKQSELNPTELKDSHSLLLVENHSHSILGIPLDQVNRLEEFSCSSIEQAGNYDVVQYRDSIMPLVQLKLLQEGLANQSSYKVDLEKHDEKLPVIVFEKGSQCFGLVVDKILDVIENDVVMQDQKPVDGMVGTAVVDGKVMEIMDVDRTMQMAFLDYNDTFKGA